MVGGAAPGIGSAGPVNVWFTVVVALRFSRKPTDDWKWRSMKILLLTTGQPALANRSKVQLPRTTSSTTLRRSNVRN